MHVEHLFVEGEKMSKSVGNTHTLADVVARGHRPSALRYLLLSSHYRKQLNFTWTGMDQAEEAIRRIVDFLARLEAVDGDGGPSKVAEVVENARKAFRSALEHDLNTAAALAAVYDLVRDVNAAIDARAISPADAKAVRQAIEEFDRVLGVVSLRQAEDASPPVPVEEIERLIEERQAARRRRDFAAADGIRRQLADRGVLLEDNPGGTRWKRNEHDDIADDRPIRQNGPAGPEGEGHHRTGWACGVAVYTRDYPLVIAQGFGATVEDVDGNVFLDCTSGIAVTATGHSHPEVVHAIVEQAQKFLHMSGTDFYYEPQVRLAEELSAIAPMPGPHRSFFGNSGTEANEAALKLASLLHEATERHRVPGRLSRAFDGLACGDGKQGDPAQRLFADGPGDVSRAVRRLLPLSGQRDS